MKKIIILLSIATVFFSFVAFPQEPFEKHIIETETIENTLLQKVFPGIVFQLETSQVTMPSRQRLVAIFEGRTFEIPYEINFLLEKVKGQSEASDIEIVEAFIQITYWLYENGGNKSVSIIPVEKRVDGVDFNFEGNILLENLEFVVLIKFQKNQIELAEVFLNNQRVTIITPELVFLPSKQAIYSITGVTPITNGGVKNYFVTVADNGVATNNSIVFTLTNLSPNQENVKVQVKPIYGYGDAFFLDHTFVVNDAGTGTFTWTPENNTNTGICAFRIVLGGTVHTIANIRIILEKKLTGNFTDAYGYTIYYTNQFFNRPAQPHPEGIAHADTFADRAKEALVESWNKQVIEWSLCQGCTNNQPHDADSNYVICINDSQNDYRGTSDNEAYGGTQRIIGIRYNSYLTQNHYSSELMRIKVAMSHEFYHGIQWSHNNNWGSGNWMLEGQARLIPTVQCGNEEFLSINHFYPADANTYLTNHLNRSLNNLSYTYGIFWRFLYENYPGGMDLIRETCRGNTNSTISGIKSFMDSKLSGNFVDILKDFARGIYLNDCGFGVWDPCPNDAYYNKPAIKSTGTIQGDCEKLERADLIPVSFGIDFHEYTIAADTIVKFVFDCDPDNDGAGSFHVNLLLFKNDNLVMELLSDVNSGTISWEIDNDEVDKVVVVVLRMDANEATQSKWDYKFEFIVLKLPLEITDNNDVTCFGKNDGSATVQASGGTPPYTYNWSNGQTGPTATNMAEGIYYVTVKDEDDCYGVIEVEINQPQKLALRINGGNAVIPFCSNLGGEPPSITLTAFASRGTPPYTYSWAGGSLTVVSSGVYTCTVTDANGCTETARAFVLFVPIVCSFDPNDITGPLGYSENQWVSVNDAMPFTIRFENDPDFASAPAQTVLVDLPIDDNLNIYDFRLESFGFGNFVFQVPPNKSTHTERLDVRDSLGIFVDITAGINIITKKAFWLFESIDPTTGLAPQDANAGFLLVNDSLGRGEGFANFSIKPKIITQTGDSIQAQAFIYFDDNASVDTNIWENKIDALPPASSIDEVVQLEDSTYNISFVGQDDTGGSGLANFLLYVAEGSGSYNLYGEVSADTIMNFTPTGAISFSLFSLAKDNVGNLEPMKEVPDTILTFIVANAGIGGQICQDDAFQISGAFTNAPNYFWTGGDGVFDDELNLNPVYTPGENDIINGEVELCLNSSISADLPTAETCLLLTINPLPDVICPDPVAICCTSDPMVLSFGSPEGGIYAGTGVLYDEIEDHYVFIPSCDQTGGKVVSYIYTDDNGCQKSCNLVIEVYSSPEVTGTNYVVCADYESFSFVADFNPSDGQFYPANNFEQGMSPGIHEFSYTFVNGPCVVSMPFSVTVNALPEISCTQNIEIPCNFGPYELSSCSPEEGSYSGNGVSYDSVSESYTFIPSCNEIGQYPITYEFSDANNCVKQAVFTITVTCPSEIAIFPEFEQVEIICEGEFLADLPSSSLNGITGNWQPEINNTETTTYTFTPDANLCATIATITIAVDPLPLTAGQISGLQIVCVDQTSVEYTVEAIEHATEYTWTLPLGAMGSSNTNSILINYPQGTVSGNVSVLGVNDCGEGTASILSVEVLYQPVDAQPIIGDAIVCQAQANILYTVPVIDNATSYSWTLPEGATGSSNTNTILINFANDTESGTISVKGVNDCFEGLQSFLEITVNPLPAEAGLITGEVEVCQGQQEVYYHIDEIEHATSYQWTLPTGASGTSSTNSIIVDFGVTAFSGQITVKGVNDCGESNISSLSIIVSPLPSQAGSINGDNIVCAGQETVVFSIPPISNSANYVWSLPTGATGSSNTNEIIVDFATGATSGEIIVKGTNDCGEGEPSSLFIEVIHQPAAASEITGSQSVCQGQADVLYSVPPIEHTTEYQWTLPEGATGTSASNTILVTFGMDAATGVISVKGSNTCFEGESSSFEIVVNPLPLAAGIIDGESIVCQGLADVVYSVPEVENATSYNWALPPGATGTSTTNTILVSFETSASTGNITVRGQNDCGFGDISTLEVQVNPKPQTPTITLLANHVLRSSATLGNQWYNQNGMIPGAINQEYQVIENGQYYVIVKVLDCGSEPSETLVINNVGIEIFDGKITLKAYPNPFTDELILEVSGSHEKLEFDILNTARQIVTTGTFVGKTIINTAGFAAGVYVVKLSNGKSFEFVKVIKAY